MHLSDDELVEKLCAIEGGLTAWEMDFIESIAKQKENGRLWLSGKQRDIGEKILRRIEEHE